MVANPVSSEAANARSKFRAKASQNGALDRARRKAASRFSPVKGQTGYTAEERSPLRAWTAPPMKGVEETEGDEARLAAVKAGRDIVPIGAKLLLYWPGSDDWFEAEVTGYCALVEDGFVMQFKHRCEYEMGCFFHDLLDMEYKALDMPPSPKQLECRESVSSGIVGFDAQAVAIARSPSSPIALPWRWSSRSEARTLGAARTCATMRDSSSPHPRTP